MKKGGTLVIVDFKKKRMPVKTPPEELRMPLHEVEDDERPALNGWPPMSSLDYQYIVIGERR